MDDKEICGYLRSKFSSLGLILLLYYGLMNLLVTVVSVLHSLWIALQHLNNLDALFTDSTIELILNGIVSNGWGYILAALICFVILLFWKKKQFLFTDIWSRGKPMMVGSFFRLLCLMFSAQAVVQMMSIVLEWVFNRLGFSIMDSLENSMVSGDTLSMFLYMGLVAPIFEEILFRGVILKTMEPYGKKFAIIASAFLFGIFHGNILQTPFAFVAGLILGYVALEYSIGWAMVLHMINNLVLGDSLNRISQLLPPWVGELILAVLIWGSLIFAVVFVIIKRLKIREAIQNDRISTLCLKSFATAPGILILTGLMYVNIILSFVMIILSQL